MWVLFGGSASGFGVLILDVDCLWDSGMLILFLNVGFVLGFWFCIAGFDVVF